MWSQGETVCPRRGTEHILIPHPIPFPWQSYEGEVFQVRTLSFQKDGGLAKVMPPARLGLMMVSDDDGACWLQVQGSSHRSTPKSGHLSEKWVAFFALCFGIRSSRGMLVLTSVIVSRAPVELVTEIEGRRASLGQTQNGKGHLSPLCDLN